LLTKLTVLELFDNLLTGTVPDPICSLTTEHELAEIEIDEVEVVCPSGCGCT